MRLPSCDLVDGALLIAPHAVWPITSTTFAPAILQANSMLPRMSSLAMLPATRALKHVADAEVHDRLGGRAGVDAAQEHRGRILSLRARSLLSQVVLRRLLARAEALVAPSSCSWMISSGVIRSRCALVSAAAQAIRPVERPSQRGGDRAGYARGFEECSAAETLRIRAC